MYASAVNPVRGSVTPIQGRSGGTEISGMFLRTPRSLSARRHEVRALRRSSTTKVELVLVIGKAGRHIEEVAALDHIAAVTLCNEGIVRDWVRHAKFNVTQGKN